MPSLYDRLSPAQRARRQELIDQLRQFAAFQRSDLGRDVNGQYDRERAGAIQAELSHIARELGPLMTQQQLIDHRGDLSRADLDELFRGPAPARAPQPLRDELWRLAEATTVDDSYGPGFREEAAYSKMLGEFYAQMREERA